MKFQKPRVPASVAEDLPILALVFIVGLLLRIVIARSLEFPNDPTALAEIRALERIALKGGWDTYYPPLYPLFLRLVFALSGASNYQAVFVVQGILSTLVVACMYIAGRSMHGRTAGLLAATVAALYPSFIVYNLTILPSSIAVVAVSLILALALIAVPEHHRAAAMGAALGVGVLFQPLLAYLAPGLLLTVKRRLVFLLVLLAVLAPWTIRNSVKARMFLPVYKKGAYQLRILRNRTAYQSWGIVNNLYFNGAALLRRTWGGPSAKDKNELRNSNYAASYSYIVIMVLGFTGLVRYYRKEHRALVAPIAGCAVLLIVLTATKMKYRLYLEPLLILYTAVLLTHAGRRLLRKRQPA